MGSTSKGQGQDIHLGNILEADARRDRAGSLARAFLLVLRSLFVEHQGQGGQNSDTSLITYDNEMSKMCTSVLPDALAHPACITVSVGALRCSF